MKIKVKMLSHGGIAIIELDDGRKCMMSVGFYETAPDGKAYIAVFALSFRWGVRAFVPLV